MMTTVMRERFGSLPVKAAEVILEGNQIRINADTKVLVDLIRSILPIPSMVKVRNGNKVTKFWPRNAEENLKTTLKQNLHDPYRLAQDKEFFENSFEGKHSDLVAANILRGEDRHELAARKAS